MPDRSRPLVERLKDWGEVRELLPKDFAGGVDWVRAVREGAIRPRAHHPSVGAPATPLGLDTLAPALNADVDSPEFRDLLLLLERDISLVPGADPFFEVRFPHSSHMLWLNCSSCHPWIIGKRGVGMEAILEGDYCGKCHGKVSFAPETGCYRCHINLKYPDVANVQEDLEQAQEDPVEATPEIVQRGEDVYRRLCTRCHGTEGDGEGPFAHLLETKPRNLTEGTFKFRSTGSGSIPTDFDLYRTITMGIKKSSMPSWAALPSVDRWALVHYVKTFAEVFTEDEPDEPLEINEPPPESPELLKLGAEVFAEMRCWDCHGLRGRGDGAAAGTMEDDWGFPIRPADFTKGVFKSGGRVQDVFRTVSTGLDGSPMPSFGDILEEEQIWAVARYVLSLAKEERGFGMKGEINFPRVATKREIPTAMFPHWFHRIRFKCTACHPAIFEMKRGANPISMDAIRSGQWCARCHNGAIAWPVGFDTCPRCHQS